jgi:Plasmid encoded RepA protein
VEVGLPWGTKPRLILAHLNAEALRQRSPEIAVENSLSAFVKRIRGFQHGREIRAFKDQLTRLSASNVRLALFREKHAQQIETRVITAFDLWPEPEDRQRVLWPSVIHLSHDYFESLQKHAVPLNEADLGALAHSAVALDIYAWLAQRLHRIAEGKAQFIPWTALKEQFGPDFGRMNNFKAFFRGTLRTVLARYQAARVELDDRGMTARCSPAPVRSRSGFVRGAKPG